MLRKGTMWALASAGKLLNLFQHMLCLFLFEFLKFYCKFRFLHRPLLKTARFIVLKDIPEVVERKHLLQSEVSISSSVARAIGIAFACFVLDSLAVNTDEGLFYSG